MKPQSSTCFPEGRKHRSMAPSIATISSKEHRSTRSKEALLEAKKKHQRHSEEVIQRSSVNSYRAENDVFGEDVNEKCKQTQHTFRHLVQNTYRLTHFGKNS